MRQNIGYLTAQRRDAANKICSLKEIASTGKYFSSKVLKKRVHGQTAEE